MIDEVLEIDKLCSKLASVCGIISKVRHILDRNSLLISLAVLLGDQVTLVSIPCHIYKPIRHACAYWTSSNLGRKTEEI